MFERQSALAGVLAATAQSAIGGAKSLWIGEVRGWSLVQIAAFPSTLAELEQAVKAILGLGLPPRIGEVVDAGTRRILKTGAEQFWIIGPAMEDPAPRFQAAVAPQVGAVTPLSHSRTRIFVEGAAAREMLARAIPLDFHPEIFGIGRFVLTGVHHTPVLVHRSAAERYEIYAMRTFAQSVWDWLTDAALPFGYEVVPPAA